MKIGPGACHHGAGQRAPAALVGKLHGRLHEARGVGAGARQRDLLQHAAPVLRLRPGLQVAARLTVGVPGALLSGRDLNVIAHLQPIRLMPML